MSSTGFQTTERAQDVRAHGTRCGRSGRCGAALATPPSGVIANTIHARGTLAPHFKIKLQESSTPGDVALQQVIFAPGGTSGWHAHPGPAIVIVKSGEFTLDQARDCSTATYTPGQVFVEPTGHVHRARNAGTTNTEIWVAYLDLPVGVSSESRRQTPVAERVVRARPRFAVRRLVQRPARGVHTRKARPRLMPGSSYMDRLRALSGTGAWAEVELIFERFRVVLARRKNAGIA